MKTITRAVIQLILTTAFLIPVTVDAATYYVATIGNDSVGCTTSQNVATPKRTISNAIGCLKAGDTLYIRAGTYTEGINTSNSNPNLQGSLTQPILISGYPGDARPIIVRPSSWPTDLATWHFGWRASRIPYYVTLRGVEMDEGSIRMEGPNITIDDVILRNAARDGVTMFSKFLTVRNSQIINCGRVQPPADYDTKGIGFYMSADDSTDMPNAIGGDNIFENNIVDGCRGGGGVIHFFKSDNNIIRNNIIRNFGTDSPWPLPAGRPTFAQYGTGVTIGGAGVLGSPGPQNNKIYNNIIYNGRGINGAYGQCVNLWGTGAGNVFDKNTCYNVNVGFWLNCSSNDLAVQNTILSQVATQSVVCGSFQASLSGWSGAKTNNLINPDVNATFVNAAAGDFRLKSGSTSLGATPNTAITAAQLPAPVVRPSSPVNLSVGR